MRFPLEHPPTKECTCVQGFDISATEEIVPRSQGNLVALNLCDLSKLSLETPTKADGDSFWRAMSIPVISGHQYACRFDWNPGISRRCGMHLPVSLGMDIVMNKEFPIPGDIIRALPASVKLIAEARWGGGARFSGAGEVQQPCSIILF